MSEKTFRPMLTYSDECHHAAADSAIEVLQELTAQYVYGVTATPKRGDGKEKINEFDPGMDCTGCLMLRDFSPYC